MMSLEVALTTSRAGGLWAAAIVACACVCVLLQRRWCAWRDDKARTFADALAAMSRYQALPLAPSRRSAADDTATRESVSQERSSIATQVRFHLVLLQSDAPVAGEAYQALYAAVRSQRERDRLAAGNAAPGTSDKVVHLGPPLLKDLDQPAIALCVRAMRNELSIMAPLHRRALRREIRDNVQTATTTL